MKHLRLFETETDYDGEVSEFEYPTVSLVQDVDDVRYMVKPYDYSQEYLTFEALESGTFTFTIPAIMPTTCVPSISYSTDYGETWVTTSNIDNQEVVITTPTITQGSKVLWKSESAQFYYNRDAYPGSNRAGGRFSSSGNYNVSGNIMSLFYGDNFIEETDLPSLAHNGFGEGALKEIFNNNIKLINAENLILPPTTLLNYCYSGMFNGCTALTTPPELPATTLATECYGSYNSSSYGMFQGCSSLMRTPVLPATTITTGCYSNMFNGCTSLTTAPELLATTLAESCYSGMFRGCTALTTTPVLSVTTMVNNCYNSMFFGCTSLTTAPALPATTLANGCYLGMFQGCTSLTTAPATLPATVTINYCYQYMFKDCTSLTTAPVLPATTLTQNCYYGMFQNCENLSYIKMMATNISAANCLLYWVANVASTGTFVKNSAATWTTTGENGVPSGWTVETASE